MKNYYILFLVSVSVTLFGCKNGEHNHAHDTHVTSDAHNHSDIVAHEHDHSALGEDIHNDKDVVVFSHKQADNAKLKATKIENAPFSHVIKCSGDIISSPADAFYIVAPTSGVISFGNPYPVNGKYVNGGDKLFTISSSNLQDGDVAYRSKIAYEKAKRDYERATELAKDMIVSEKELSDIKVEYENAKAAYEAVNGIDGNGSAVIAPVGGYISQILVNNGDFVNMGQTIAMISKNSKLILRAGIEHEDFTNLPKMKSANFKLPFDDTLYKLSDMNGKILSYGKYISHGENFIDVTFEFDNKYNLIPGSYADIFIISNVSENSLAVPLSAICEEEGLLFVFTRIDCEHFRKTYVVLGESNGECVEILEGVKSGDIVVTEGVHQLKAASRKSVIPAGHSHSH